MGDILSAISLLLAIETALFGFIYPDIKKSLEFIPHKFPVDDKDNFSFVKGTMISKLIPLLILGIVIPLLFLPEVINVMNETITAIKLHGWVYSNYSTSYAVILFIDICLFALLFYLLRLFIALIIKLKSIDPKRNK